MGRPESPEARADGAEIEARVLRDETLASARRMRLCFQTRFWTDPAFAEHAKPLLHELDRIERRLADPERVA